MGLETKIKKILNYIVSYDAEAVPKVSELSVAGMSIPMPYELSIDNQKVITSAQILDGEEVFVRVGTRSPSIRISGTMYINIPTMNFRDQIARTDSALSGGDYYRVYVKNTPEERGRILLETIELFDYIFNKEKAVLKVDSLILNKMGITDILPERCRIQPIVGNTGFTYEIEAKGVNRTIDSYKQTLFV
jgi:hypothetical protein